MFQILILVYYKKLIFPFQKFVLLFNTCSYCSEHWLVKFCNFCHFQRSKIIVNAAPPFTVNSTVVTANITYLTCFEEVFCAFSIGWNKFDRIFSP